MVMTKPLQISDSLFQDLACSRMRDAGSVNHAVNRRFALFITTLAAFLSPFAISSINIALPSIGKEFLMDAVLLSWVGTAYLLATAIILVPFGKIADIYGRKKIFTYGIMTFTLASVGSAISNSAMMLIGFRILQGIGAAATYCIGAAILTSIFPPKELDKVLGINVAAVYLGASFGQFFGGFLTQYFGWKSIFVINVFLESIIIVFIFWKLKGEWREEEEKKFDPCRLNYSRHHSLAHHVWFFSSLGDAGCLAHSTWGLGHLRLHQAGDKDRKSCCGYKPL